MLSPLVEQPALEHVVREESSEVADMSTVINRRATAIKLDPPFFARRSELTRGVTAGGMQAANRRVFVPWTREMSSRVSLRCVIATVLEMYIYKKQVSTGMTIRTYEYTNTNQLVIEDPHGHGYIKA